MTDPESLISETNLAKRLRVPRSTVARWRKAGMIPCFKTGNLIRYDMEEVMKTMKENGKKK